MGTLSTHLGNLRGIAYSNFSDSAFNFNSDIAFRAGLVHGHLGSVPMRSNEINSEKAKLGELFGLKLLVISLAHNKHCIGDVLQGFNIDRDFAISPMALSLDVFGFTLRILKFSVGQIHR